MVKLPRLLITIALIVGAYYWNSQANIMPMFPWTGLILLVWIVIGALSMGVEKIYRNKKGLPPVVKHSYALPNAMASMMKNVDLRTQYESAILSSFLIIVGILSMAIYFIFFYPVGIWFKILTGMNAIFGMMFLSSNLVTVYQQYVIYMQTQVMEKVGLETGEMLPADFGGMDTKVITDEVDMLNDKSTEKEDSKNA